MVLTVVRVVLITARQTLVPYIIPLIALPRVTDDVDQFVH
jgi:phage shock protein PspC (stress-responsive transcriptional regulator)